MIIDTAHLPVVVQRPTPHDELGRGERWRRAMDALLRVDVPFAFVALRDLGEDSEPAGDRRIRTMWMKENAAGWARLCRGVWRVDPDPERRAAAEVRLVRMAAASGVTFALAADEATAVTEAGSACVAADRAAVLKLFDALLAAMSARDFAAMAALLAPGFQYKEPGSDPIDAASLIARERAASANDPRSTGRYELQDIMPDRDQAVVAGAMTFTTEVTLAGQAHRYEGRARFDGRLRRHGPGWQFDAIRYGGLEILRDGRPHDPTQAIAEMHGEVRAAGPG